MSAPAFATLAPAEIPRVMRGMVGDRLGTFARLSQRYPDGVRIPLPGKSVVVCSSDAALRHVLVDHASRYTKGLGQAEARDLLGSGILTGEGDHWQEQRRSIGPLLRARRVSELVPDIVEEARSSVDSLDVGEVAEEVEVSLALADYTLACLARVLGFHHPDTRSLVEAFDAVQDEAMFQSLTMARTPRWLRPGTLRRVRDAQSTLTSEAERVRRAVGSEDVGPWAERDAVVSLLLAGYETTSSTLTWAMAHLGRRPRLQRLLAREGEALRSGDVAAGPGIVDALPHARAVFQEVLRLQPPVWLLSRRAQEPDVVDGRQVDAGDDVVFFTSTLGDPGPQEFCPGTQGRGTHPFGMGPRACPGSQLAEVEAVVWLALAASRLEWEVPPGRPVAGLARMSQTVAGGLHCRIRSREPDGGRGR